MSMIFLKNNEFNTTTQAFVDAVNTLTVNRILDRNIKTQWATVGYGTTTSTVFSIEFATSTSISRIYLQNHNLKQFRIFYNSTTASTFTPNITYTTNSETSQYFEIATTSVLSLQIQCDLAMAADTEKAIGEVYLGNVLLNLERNPSAANYKPMVLKERTVHRMPNKGVSVFIGEQKFKSELSWKFVSNSFTSQLLDIYETGSSFYFTPFPTTTAWDGKSYLVNWTNDFDFKYSDNNTGAGQGGRIILEESA